MVSRRFLRIKALKALYAHMSSNSDSIIPAQKKMLFSVAKSYELYHIMLRLIVDVADYAGEMIEVNKTKLLATDEELNPNMRLTNNRLVAKIRNSEQLNSFLSKNGLEWSRDNELMKLLHTSMIESEYYKEYMKAEKDGWENDKKFVIDFYRNEIEDNEFLYSILEDMSIYWIDEIEFITSKVVNHLTKQRSSDPITIYPLYQNDDDREFVKDLFVQSIIQYDDNVEIIRLYAQNWEVERITVMDRLIIIMAIVELEKFSSIPTNVTLDEYIEIAKHYSTRNSNVFINGILNKYIKDKNITK